MLRYIYSAFFYLAIPFILIRLLYKARKNKQYLFRIPERFGFISTPIEPGGIWLHAVSVGEVIASVPLIKKLQKQYPHFPITITTMTPTGADRVRAAYEDTVKHVYVPYDIPFAMKRFLNTVKPSLVLIMETELWPNLLYYCYQRGCPTVLMNARLSEKSARGYGRIASLTGYMLRRIALIAAQTKEEAARFLALGADPSQLVVTGSVKFDIQIPASIHEKAQVFRQRFGNERLIWVAASTHEGEEEKVLTVFAKLRKQFPRLLLILVPRHPERFPKVTQLCKKQGFSVLLRSTEEKCKAETDIVIGDSMGELCAYYGASDVAFVGGSFIPVGGHNLLEPAALAVPAVTGPYVFNFEEITRLLVSAGGAVKVETLDELENTLEKWLLDASERNRVGEKALHVVQQNGGALEAHLQCIQELLATRIPAKQAELLQG